LHELQRNVDLNKQIVYFFLLCLEVLTNNVILCALQLALGSVMLLHNEYLILKVQSVSLKWLTLPHLCV